MAEDHSTNGDAPRPAPRPTHRPPPAGPPPDPASPATRSEGRGRTIVRVAWWATGVFVLLAAAATAAPEAFGGPALVLDVVLFVAGCVLFGVAFLRAAGRSRTDAIGIGGLFFLAGDVAPADVRRHLLGALAVQTTAALVTAGIRLYTNLAAGVLVPMFGLGLCGLWAATYGRFGPRTQPAPTRPPATRPATRRPATRPPDPE